MKKTDFNSPKHPLLTPSHLYQHDQPPRNPTPEDISRYNQLFKEYHEATAVSDALRFVFLEQEKIFKELRLMHLKKGYGLSSAPSVAEKALHTALQTQSKITLEAEKGLRAAEKNATEIEKRLFHEPANKENSLDSFITQFRFRFHLIKELIACRKDLSASKPGSHNPAHSPEERLATLEKMFQTHFGRPAPKTLRNLQQTEEEVAGLISKLEARKSFSSSLATTTH